MRRLSVLTALVLAVLATGGKVAIGDQPPIRIGIISTYSGPLQAGKTYDAAFSAYMKAHGDTVAGRKIELIRRDDGGIAPEVARRMAQELITQEHVDFLAGFGFTPDAHPDAVFAMVNGNGGRPFMDAYTQAGLGKAGVKVLVSQDVVLDENLPGIGDQAIGIISAGTYSPSHNSALNKQFVRDYKTFTDSDPDFLSVGAYDCLAAIYKVVAAQNGQLDPDRTMQLVKQLKFESPRGPIEMDPQTRDLIENVYIRRTEKRNGRLVNTEIETIPMVRDPLEH